SFSTSRSLKCLIKKKVLLIMMSAYIFLLDYLHRILKNHTAHACDGETLSIRCPTRTSVAVVSAFYGRRVPSPYLCPQANPNITEENTDSLRRVSRKCHGRTNCSVLADAQGFGDPCFPGTKKHLRVSFTCATRQKH
uniref:SUEL-type lectin domain-containing protein n=1 Tax=Sinocyclocheilus anshuiensis TaxID=1608454 RepID=A0A671N588_9TELE